MNSFSLNYSQPDNHPLIPNQNTYYKQKKTVMITSSDRNIIKYPESSTFEILLPTDIVNVASVQLTNWTLPTTHDTFSPNNNNLQFEFTLLPLTGFTLAGDTTIPFNYDASSEYPDAGIVEISNEYVEAVNEFLLDKNNRKFIITINEGTYLSIGLAYEMQNKMNIAVNNRILNYLESTLKTEYYVPYTFFQVIVNEIQSTFWFINTLNSFIFNNDSLLYTANNIIGETFLPCSTQRVFPSFVYYGLPAYLGFVNTLIESRVCINKYELTLLSSHPPITPLADAILKMPPSVSQPTFLQNYIKTPTEVKFINVNYIKPLNKFTIIKNTSIFLDISTLNGADSTRPFTNNEFTKITNQGNGSVKSFLGRVTLIPATINFAFSSSSSGGETQPVVNFNPPLERLTRFKINLRYHDGSLVNFGFHEWMITLQLESFLPSQNVKLTQTPF